MFTGGNAQPSDEAWAEIIEKYEALNDAVREKVEQINARIKPLTDELELLRAAAPARSSRT